MVAVDTQPIHGLAERRAARPSGISGLLNNPKVFAVAVFASLGGFVYGYNQGMFGQIMNMYSFQQKIKVQNITNPTTRGLLTSILELGAWIGVLVNGYLADATGRKMCTVIGVVVFCIGVIVQACAQNADFIYGGRFVTGLGVGSLSMIVPLYNAELSPPEIRGGLVALQQLAITFGIMVSYWIGYGTNYIGGTGEGQSDAAWLIPICIQIAPAVVLGVGILFMPQSPRWLVNKGFEEEALNTLSSLRNLPTTDESIRIEFLEIKAQHIFDLETSRELFPDLQDGSRKSNFLLGYHSYKQLFVHPGIRKRTLVAVMTMLFQQWSGVNGIVYYAAFIFQDLGLTGSTVSLLASGVVGIMMFVFTIPTVLWVDKWGRKPVLIAGALGMAICLFIDGGIAAAYWGDFQDHGGAGWVAVVFCWIFIANFGYSWGPCAWVVVSEVFPLAYRAKGVSIGASSNWLNNFAVAMATSDMFKTMKYGAYFFFGVIIFIGAFYVHFFVPETKGRTLEEIDELFKDNSGTGAADNARMMRIYEELGLTDTTVPLIDFSNPKGEKEQFIEKDVSSQEA